LNLSEILRNDSNSVAVLPDPRDLDFGT
jgi:hypothetical protein